MWNIEQSLYPFQQRAAREMRQANVLLAYEMGTGKTPTTLAAIEQLRSGPEPPVTGTGTVVVPSSLKFQWADEIRKFTDQHVVVIDGMPRSRASQYEVVRGLQPGYMITSYDNFVRDHNMRQFLGTAFLVLDEATAIKSFSTKRTKYIQGVAHQYPVRFALTGTPIQNGKLEELFSIMRFVEPSVLGPWGSFERRFIRRNPMGWIDGYRNVGELHQYLNRVPTFQRATHDEPEVAAVLPRMIEHPLIKVKLSPGMRYISDGISFQILNDLEEFVQGMQVTQGGLAQAALLHPDGDLMAKITVLRQFLSRPQSVLESESKFAIDLLKQDGVDPKALDIEGDKMKALVQYTKDFLDSEDGKVVIFTTFVATADHIQRHFPNSSILTGDMSPKQRHANVQRFKTDPGTRVFVSTDAGGTGLDLPQGRIVINYDLPWSPGDLSQRNARIKRASSEWRHVVVQNMVCSHTIEERMVDMLRHKMETAGAVLDGKHMVDGEFVSEINSLRQFLLDYFNRKD